MGPTMIVTVELTKVSEFMMAPVLGRLKMIVRNLTSTVMGMGLMVTLKKVESQRPVAATFRVIKMNVQWVWSASNRAAFPLV